MDPEQQIRVVFVTFPDVECARRIAGGIVERGRAACANLVPGVESIYRWEGELHRDAEVLGIFKCAVATLPDFTQAVVEMHPYEVPEVVVLPVDGGHGPYLEWVRASCSTAVRGRGGDEG
jgi:periplasmic divalent cation tolerance protein